MNVNNLESKQEINILVATKIMGFEFLRVGYFGDPETETPRQVELEEWLDNVGIDSVGDYYIDVKNNNWLRADGMWPNGWSPSTDIVAAMQVAKKTRISIIASEDGWYIVATKDVIHTCDRELNIAKEVHGKHWVLAKDIYEIPAAICHVALLAANHKR